MSEDKNLDVWLLMCISFWFGFAFGFLFVCGGGII